MFMIHLYPIFYASFLTMYMIQLYHIFYTSLRQLLSTMECYYTQYSTPNVSDP